MAYEARCAGYAGTSAALATVLNPVVGYLPAAALVKESLQTGVPAVELAVRKGLLTRQAAERLLSPERITGEE